jgi:hypothetical protein
MAEEKTKLVNLTAHEITLFVNGSTYRLPPSGTVARCRSSYHACGRIDGLFDVVRCVFGRVAGLPQPKENTYYVVSGLVLGVLRGTRDDVLAPDTGPTAIRDEFGNVVGVRRFLRG